MERPTDWAALEKAFNERTTILGTVTGVVKGGLSVDVGVRAFMPASRSGARDAAEMEKLVEQEIRCRIIKLDATEEDVVVDRRVVLEEQARTAAEAHFGAMNEGDVVIIKNTGNVATYASGEGDWQIDFAQYSNTNGVGSVWTGAPAETPPNSRTV